MRPAFTHVANVGRWSSPISVGTRGRGSPLLPRHSSDALLVLPLPFKARCEVALEFVATIAVVARAWIAVQGFKEVELCALSAPAFHEHDHGTGEFVDVRKAFGVLRNV